MSNEKDLKARITQVSNTPEAQAHEDAIRLQRINERRAVTPLRVDNCFADFDLEAHRASKFLKTYPPEYDWLIDGSLQQGQVGMVAAPGGIGKSFLLLQLGMTVASGTDFLNGIVSASKKGPVMAVFAEDDEATIHRRIQAIAGHCLDSAPTGDLDFSAPTPFADKAKHFDDLIVFSGVGHDMRFFEKKKENLRTTQTYEAFLARCKEIDGVSLVILDPISRFYTENENDNQTATFFASLLERIAKETGATVIAIHHTAKLSKGDEPTDKYLQQDAARGASGFVNAVRWQLNLAPLNRNKIESIGGDPERSGHYLAAKVVKKNAGPPETQFYLERGHGGVLTSFNPIEKASSKVKEQILSKLNDLAQEDKRYTLNGFLKAYGNKKNFGMGRDRLSPILDSMIESTEIVRIPVKNGSGQFAQYIFTKEVAEDMKVAEQQELPK